jgi:hypothetical protein
MAVIGNIIRITVSDDGPGMSNADLPTATVDKRPVTCFRIQAIKSSVVLLMKACLLMIR